MQRRASKREEERADETRKQRQKSRQDAGATRDRARDRAKDGEALLMGDAPRLGKMKAKTAILLRLENLRSLILMGLTWNLIPDLRLEI